jgi:hypothetical protein
MEVRCQLHAPAALPPGNRTRYPLERRLGGPQRRSARRGEGNNSVSTGTQTATARPSSPHPVAIPTELSRLPVTSIKYIIKYLIM